MTYLIFERSEGTDGAVTLEAMVSTDAAEHQAALAEVNRVLDWAWHRFPVTHGPFEEGGDWDHDLHVTVEDARWWVITLTLSGSADFVDELLKCFGG